MELERKQFTANVQPGDAGEITALVSVFGNTDFANERVMPGAFTKSLAKKLPRGVWAHDWSLPVAKTLEARETDKGLVIRAQFNLDTQRGREAFSDLKGGYIDEFSIGYKVIKDSVDTKSGVRELHELALYEFSPVLVGMNDSTALLSVKSENAPDVPATLDNQVDTMLAYGHQLANRFEAIRDLREKDGRHLSSAKRQQITACRDLFDALLVVPSPKADDAEARRLYAEFLKTLIKN